MNYEVEKLESLTFRELQTLAKANGIKANQRSEDMVAQLVELQISFPPSIYNTDSTVSRTPNRSTEARKSGPVPLVTRETLSNMKYNQLRSLAKSVGTPAKGKAVDLIESILASQSWNNGDNTSFLRDLGLETPLKDIDHSVFFTPHPPVSMLESQETNRDALEANLLDRLDIPNTKSFTENVEGRVLEVSKIPSLATSETSDADIDSNNKLSVSDLSANKSECSSLLNASDSMTDAIAELKSSSYLSMPIDLELNLNANIAASVNDFTVQTEKSMEISLAEITINGKFDGNSNAVASNIGISQIPDAKMNAISETHQTVSLEILESERVCQKSNLILLENEELHHASGCMDDITARNSSSNQIFSNSEHSSKIHDSMENSCSKSEKIEDFYSADGGSSLNSSVNDINLSQVNYEDDRLYNVEELISKPVMITPGSVTKILYNDNDFSDAEFDPDFNIEDVIFSSPKLHNLTRDANTHETSMDLERNEVHIVPNVVLDTLQDSDILSSNFTNLSIKNYDVLNENRDDKISAIKTVENAEHSALKSLVNTTPYLSWAYDGARVRCDLTGHEVVATLSNVLAYLSSKKMKLIISSYNATKENSMTSINSNSEPVQKLKGVPTPKGTKKVFAEEQYPKTAEKNQLTQRIKWI